MSVSRQECLSVFRCRLNVEYLLKPSLEACFYVQQLTQTHIADQSAELVTVDYSCPNENLRNMSSLTVQETLGKGRQNDYKKLDGRKNFVISSGHDKTVKLTNTQQLHKTHGISVQSASQHECQETSEGCTQELEAVDGTLKVKGKNVADDLEKVEYLEEDYWYRHSGK